MNYLEQMKEMLDKFIKESEENINHFFNNLSKEILETYEKYKKIGEEDQSEEIQKLRQGFDEFLKNIEQFLKNLDIQLTEFLIEAQKHSEFIMQQIQSFFKEINITEFQNKINDFTAQLQNQPIENIVNTIQNIFLQQSQQNNQEIQESDKTKKEDDKEDEDISIIFSESDTKE
ncbi:MAG: hypothetical protein KatS3mg129_1813 [Leptospiraceae bacterium]|nr:MAG: hypothetical protein KatS3mg129_1813 [Leptospiraceae bacterium]